MRSTDPSPMKTAHASGPLASIVVFSKTNNADRTAVTAVESTIGMFALELMVALLMVTFAKKHQRKSLTRKLLIKSKTTLLASLKITSHLKTSKMSPIRRI